MDIIYYLSVGEHSDTLAWQELGQGGLADAELALGG